MKRIVAMIFLLVFAGSALSWGRETTACRNKDWEDAYFKQHLIGLAPCRDNKRPNWANAGPRVTSDILLLCRRDAHNRTVPRQRHNNAANCHNELLVREGATIDRVNDNRATRSFRTCNNRKL